MCLQIVNFTQNKFALRPIQNFPPRFDLDTRQFDTPLISNLFSSIYMVERKLKYYYISALISFILFSYSFGFILTLRYNCQLFIYLYLC